jgi:signal transduction histidine kinase
MRKVFLYLIFSISISIFAQKKQGQALIDSLQIELAKKEGSQKADVYHELFLVYLKKDVSEAEKNATAQLTLSNKIQYKDGIALAKRNLGIISTTKSDFDSAIQSYNSALTFTKNKKIQGQIYGSLGKVYYLKSNYPSSLEYFNKSLSIFEDIQEVALQKSVMQSISSIYIAIGDNEKAREYITKAKQVSSQPQPITNKEISQDANKDNNIIHKLNIHDVTQNGTEFNTNEIFDKKQIDAAVANKNPLEKSNKLREIASIYFKQKKFEAANYCLNASLQIEEKRKNDLNIALIHSLLGDSYNGKAKIVKKNSKLLVAALQQYETALSLYIKLKNNFEISENYKKKAAIEKLLGNYQDAIESNSLYVKHRDSIFNDSTKFSIKHVEDLREIELKDKELKIKQLELASKEKQKWLYILGIVLFASMGGFLFFQSQSRKKTNEKLQLLNSELDQANKTKTRFFSILNHDLRSPVANLIHFLHIQKDSPELLDEETKNRMQHKTISGAEDLLSSMEDILLWSKGQMENFKPQPKNITILQLFEDTQKVFSGYQKIQFEYQNPDNISVFTDENYLKTIVRNLTSNAINVFTSTQQPKIIWKAWQENNSCYLSVTDNGPGARQEQFKALYDDKEVVGIKSGLGLHLIRDLAKAIDCEISVVSETDEGTTFTLKL